MLSIPCGSPTSNVVGLPPPPPPLSSSWLFALTAVKPASKRTQTSTAASRFMVPDSLTALHQMPVKELFESAIEIELWTRPEEAMCLSWVGHILECLAELQQARHELLRLLRADAHVALPVRDQERHPDLLEAVVGR